jgi:ABC-type phosphate/phosphonate transport system permease subunit
VKGRVLALALVALVIACIVALTINFLMSSTLTPH